MLSNDYLTNIEIEIKKLEQIAIKANISPKKVKYWKNLIKINQNNLKADMYLHLFEKAIRKAIISKSINYSKFWDYRSTASITYEANMKEEANYARSLPPKKIESFFSKNKKGLNEKNCIAFNSGMAAINAVLIIVQKLTKSSLGVYTEYFETTALLKEVMTDIHIYSNKKQLLEDMSFNNFFFLENPISSPNKENILLEDIYDVISKRINDKKIFILVVDSTLELNDNDYLFEFLKLSNKILIFKIRSALKLDQLGLELLNLGIVEVYSNLKFKDRNFIVEMLKNYRTVSGGSIDYNSYLRLVDTPFNLKDIKEYKIKILENTMKLYKKLLLVNSKSFSIEYKKGLPYIFLKPKSKNFRLKDWVNDSLREIRRKKGYLPYGTSFGFRHSRLEIIDNNKELPFIRFSPGEYIGKSNDILIEMMEDSNATNYTK